MNLLGSFFQIGPAIYTLNVFYNAYDTYKTCTMIHIEMHIETRRLRLTSFISSKQFHRINVGKLVVICYANGMVLGLLSTPNQKGNADKKRIICLKNFTFHSRTFDIGK